MWPRITPLVPVTEETLRTLTSLTHTAANCHSQLGDGVVYAYQQWVEDTVSQLSSLFEPADVEQLIRTRAYWETLDVPATLPQVLKIVHYEIDAVVKRLTGLWTELGATHRQWSLPCFIVVPDTNVYVEHDVPFDKIDWYAVVNSRPDRPLRVVVPLMVLDELDGLKVTHTRSKDNEDRRTKGWRIRYTLRRFEELLPLEGAPLPDCRHDGSGTVTIEALPDPLLHRRLDVNDAEIVARSVALRRLTGHPITIVTNDTAMLTRAWQAGLRSTRLTPFPDESVPTE